MIVRQLTRWAWATFLCLGLGACQTGPDVPIKHVPSEAAFDAWNSLRDLDDSRPHDRIPELDVAIYNCGTSSTVIVDGKQEIPGRRSEYPLLFKIKTGDSLPLSVVIADSYEIINFRIHVNINNLQYIIKTNDGKILRINGAYERYFRSFFEIAGIYLIAVDSFYGVWSWPPASDVCRSVRSTSKMALAGAAVAAAMGVSGQYAGPYPIGANLAGAVMGHYAVSSSDFDLNIDERFLKYAAAARYPDHRSPGRYVFREDDSVLFHEVHLNEDGRWCRERSFFERLFMPKECPPPVRVTSSAGMQPFSMEYGDLRSAVIFRTTTDFYLLPEQILRTLRFEGALTRGCTYDTARKYKSFEGRREILVVSCDDPAKAGRSLSSSQLLLAPAVPAAD